MRMLIGGIITFIGIVMAVRGIYRYALGKTSTFVIGGADGPTSVFVAGKVGDGFELGTVIVGGILVVAGIIIFLKYKKNSHDK